MTLPTNDKGPSFVTREPVVTAGGSTVGAVGLTYAIMELCEAYDWQHFSAAQSKAIIGIVVIVAGIGSSLLAAQRVTPSNEVERRVLEAWLAPPPLPEPVAVPATQPSWVFPGGAPMTANTGPIWNNGPTAPPATAATAPSSAQVMADAQVAHTLATEPAVPVTNIDDIDPGHHAGAIMDGTIADPFAAP